jgi:hypothetical protein
LAGSLVIPIRRCAGSWLMQRQSWGGLRLEGTAIDLLSDEIPEVTEHARGSPPLACLGSPVTGGVKRRLPGVRCR